MQPKSQWSPQVPETWDKFKEEESVNLDEWTALSNVEELLQVGEEVEAPAVGREGVDVVEKPKPQQQLNSMLSWMHTLRQNRDKCLN